jgi:hypothetical protein
MATPIRFSGPNALILRKSPPRPAARQATGEWPLFAHLRRLNDVSNRREADFADRGVDVALGLDCEIATIREERSGRSPFCEVATAPTGRQAWIKSDGRVAWG